MHKPVKNVFKQLTCRFNEYPEHTSDTEQRFWSRPIANEGIWQWASAFESGKWQGRYYLVKCLLLKIAMPAALKTAAVAVGLALLVAGSIALLPQDTQSPVVPEHSVQTKKS